MIEELLHEALKDKAAQITPHGHARTENIRRLAAHRRNRRLRLFAAGAVATACVVVGVVAWPGGSSGRVRSLAPRSVPAPISHDPLPADLDPRYRPTSDVVRIDGIDMWYAGSLLCWFRPTGSGPQVAGGCGDAYRPFDKTPVAVLGVRDQRMLTPSRFQSVIFGTAPSSRTRVTVTTNRPRPNSRTHGTEVVELATATLYTSPTFPRPIWSVTVIQNGPDGPMDGLSINHSAPHPMSSLGALFDPARPAVPLTLGTPLFTSGLGTMKVYAEGDSIEFGIDTVTAGGRGIGNSFGGVFHDSDGQGGQWWWGVLAPSMSRVDARLNDGRTFTGQITRVGSQHVFAVHLPGVPLDHHNDLGMLVGYDTAGHQINTWKI